MKNWGYESESQFCEELETFETDYKRLLQLESDLIGQKKECEEIIRADRQAETAYRTLYFKANSELKEAKGEIEFWRHKYEQLAAVRFEVLKQINLDKPEKLEGRYFLYSRKLREKINCEGPCYYSEFGATIGGFKCHKCLKFYSSEEYYC